METRYLEKFVLSDLKERMVFLGGPRQVGKTTLAKNIGETAFRRPQYLNWDFPADRQAIQKMEFAPDKDLLVLDEVHKWLRWKGAIKGLYDVTDGKFPILVTGSARMDVYRKGGDSLLGRYAPWTLHPFSVAELAGRSCAAKPFQPLGFPSASAWGHAQTLLKFGGFPRPLFAQEEGRLRRWHRERAERLVREDIRDVESVRDLAALETLVRMLPERAGSILSVNGLREDLGLAHATVARWIEILERFYYAFRVPPYAAKIARAVKKEPKVYLWDWSEVPDAGARFENMVASHLLKFCHFLRDAQGWQAELHFMRDTTGREVDFLVTVDRKPWFCAECKLADTAVSPNLAALGDQVGVPLRYQVVMQDGVDFEKNGVRVMGAGKFLAGLA